MRRRCHVRNPLMGHAKQQHRPLTLLSQRSQRVQMLGAAHAHGVGKVAMPVRLFQSDLFDLHIGNPLLRVIQAKIEPRFADLYLAL